MCDPMTLIGAGLSTAGGIANAQQQAYADEVNNQNNIAYQMSKAAREQEQTRQDAFEKQAQAAWQQNMDAFTAQKAAQNQDTAANQFMQKYDQTATQQNADGQYLSGQQFANDEVKTAIADRSAKAAADARTRAQALANLTAYGTTQTGDNISMSNTNNDLTTLNGIRRGSLTVSNQEQNISPAKVTQGTGGLGDILGGMGKVVSKIN